MLATVNSCAVVGMDGQIIKVEVDISRGQLPSTTIVGLPDAAVQESRERVRAAIRNGGLTYPFSSRITVNLAPADTKKEGPAYDLPIAVGMLVATGQIVADLDDAVFLGELALTGDVRPVRGVLPMAALARKEGLKRVFVPTANAAEASLVEGVEVFAVPSLGALAAHLLGAAQLDRGKAAETTDTGAPKGTDFADIVGQEHAKRALEVAASGGHNLIMRGPPGSGKTLMARAIPSILPRMSGEEAMEVTRVYSVAGLLKPGSGLLTERPFRAPHHTISNAGLVGGGSMPRPGEVTLAHRGVLFLDELPEFDPRVLEVLRQPLEDRVVTISRARMSVAFPANFTLIASQNPCQCGYFGDPERDCSCSPQLVSRYQHRISGPLLDRIDLFVDVPRVPYEKLANLDKAEPSEAVARRVSDARTVQLERFQGLAPEVLLNSDMGPAEVRTFAQGVLTPAAANLLQVAVKQLNLSARAFHRILKVALTVADLGHATEIDSVHVAEAIQYRQRGE